MSGQPTGGETSAQSPEPDDAEVIAELMGLLGVDEDAARRLLPHWRGAHVGDLIEIGEDGVKRRSPPTPWTASRG